MDKRRILVIDNDPVFESQLREHLQMAGIEVTSTDDGRAGLDTATGSPPDAVLVAAELPGMSGYSLCNRLKRAQQTKDTPVVIVSSGETPETFEQHQSHKNHADLYLLKDQSAGTVAKQLLALLGGNSPPPSPVEPIEDDELDSALDGLTAPTAVQAEPAVVEAVEDVVEEAELVEDLEPVEGTSSTPAGAAPSGNAPLGADSELDSALDGLTAPASPAQEKDQQGHLRRGRRLRLRWQAQLPAQESQET